MYGSRRTGYEGVKKKGLVKNLILYKEYVAERERETESRFSREFRKESVDTVKESGVWWCPGRPWMVECRILHAPRTS